MPGDHVRTWSILHTGADAQPANHGDRQRPALRVPHVEQLIYVRFAGHLDARIPGDGQGVAMLRLRGVGVRDDAGTGLAEHVAQREREPRSLWDALGGRNRTRTYNPFCVVEVP